MFCFYTDFNIPSKEFDAIKTSVRDNMLELGESCDRQFDGKDLKLNLCRSLPADAIEIVPQALYISKQDDVVTAIWFTFEAFIRQETAPEKTPIYKFTKEVLLKLRKILSNH